MDDRIYRGEGKPSHEWASWFSRKLYRPKSDRPNLEYVHSWEAGAHYVIHDILRFLHEYDEESPSEAHKGLQAALLEYFDEYNADIPDSLRASLSGIPDE